MTFNISLVPRARNQKSAPRKNSTAPRSAAFIYSPQTVDVPQENAYGYGAHVSGAMFYNYFRSYCPSCGRYTQPDPIGLAGGGSRHVYADNDPIQYVDPQGLFNPAKAASAAGNAAIAGASAGSGGIKIAAAIGLSPAAATGVGALPPAALASWGAWNLKASTAAWARAKQQWSESLCEDVSQAHWKNFYGLLPGGTHYDDPGEASGPLDYIQNKGWWHFIKDLGYF